MDDVLPLLVVAGCLVAVLGAFTALARLARRRGLAGSAVRAALAAYEEAWHAGGHESHQELRVQAERTVAVPAPGDPGPWNVVWREGEAVG